MLKGVAEKEDFGFLAEFPRQYFYRFSYITYVFLSSE